MKLNQELLKQKLLDEQLSPKEISNQLSCSYSYVIKKIKEYGFPKSRKYKDITGKKFHNLTVIKISDKTIRKAIWECKCSCGNITHVVGNALRRGEIRSCGCLRKIIAYGDISGYFFTRIKRHAEKRQIYFDICIKNIWELFIKQDKKCALTGIDLVLTRKRGSDNTASLDRIDSSKGYTLDNIRWVHKEINIMKMDLSDIELIEWAKKLVSFNQKSK